jgi:hypothetical protein
MWEGESRERCVFELASFRKAFGGVARKVHERREEE